MIRLLAPCKSGLCCLSLASVLGLQAAHAADEPAVGGDDGSGAMLPGHRSAPPALTAEQLEVFAELVGEPRPVVWQRLQMDPALLAMVAAAADARMERKSSGKVRTAVGFSIFGAGGIAGYVVMLTAFSPRDCGYDNDTCYPLDGRRLAFGLIIMAASAGLGLGIGIPGIISMVRQSAAETAAVDRYAYPQMPLPPPFYRPSSSSAPVGLVVKVPLLSVAF
jgi:hypothetical protein